MSAEIKKLISKDGSVHYYKRVNGKLKQFFGNNEKMLNDDWYWTGISLDCQYKKEFKNSLK